MADCRRLTPLFFALFFLLFLHQGEVSLSTLRFSTLLHNDPAAHQDHCTMYIVHMPDSKPGPLWGPSGLVRYLGRLSALGLLDLLGELELPDALLHHLDALRLVNFCTAQELNKRWRGLFDLEPLWQNTNIAGVYGKLRNIQKLSFFFSYSGYPTKVNNMSFFATSFGFANLLEFQITAPHCQCFKSSATAFEPPLLTVGHAPCREDWRTDEK